MCIHEPRPPRPLLARAEWGILGAMLAVHALPIAVPSTFSWGGLICFLLFHWLAFSLGVSLCYHRLLTHRAFRVPRFLEAMLAIFGCLALQLDPIFWVGIHRKHHAYADREGDPHSPRKSFWWGYLGWMIFPDGESPRAMARRYAPDLVADPLYRFLQRTYLLYPLMLGAGLYAIGGWSYVVWGLALPVIVVWHSMSLLNACVHRWGYRRYPTRDHSTNLWWLALITYGENWHNNHHGEPRAASFARSWWEIDPTWGAIRLLEMLRLARDVQRPRRAILGGEIRRPTGDRSPVPSEREILRH